MPLPAGSAYNSGAGRSCSCDAADGSCYLRPPRCAPLCLLLPPPTCPHRLMPIVWSLDAETSRRRVSEEVDDLLAHVCPDHAPADAASEDDALGERLRVIWEVEPGASMAHVPDQA